MLAAGLALGLVSTVIINILIVRYSNKRIIKKVAILNKELKKIKKAAAKTQKEAKEQKEKLLKIIKDLENLLKSKKKPIPAESE